MYCTIEQLEERLSAPVLGQRVPEIGEDREKVLNGYIARASAHIDSRISVRYNTPATSSRLLEDICLDICLWQIEADRGTFGDKMPTRVQIPYDEAQKTLADLASGKIELPGVNVSEGTVAGLVVSSPRSYFQHNSDGMEYF